MIRKEIHRFLDTVFDGAAAPLIAHLAEMDELTLSDLKEVEDHLTSRRSDKAKRKRRK
jgi:predicted transcriptional regulator